MNSISDKEILLNYVKNNYNDNLNQDIFNFKSIKDSYYTIYDDTQKENYIMEYECEDISSLKKMFGQLQRNDTEGKYTDQLMNILLAISMKRKPQEIKVEKTQKEDIEPSMYIYNF